MVIFIVSFLLGAWVTKMYYAPIIKSALSERDVWENKAKQAQANMYSDIIKNSSKEIKDYEI
jgi:hypothetical protein